MYCKLGEIAEISFGSYEKPKSEGSIKYLHAGHFDSFIKPTKFENSYVELSPKNKKYLLRSNDVILAGKGYRTFAWSYVEDIGKAMPSSLFYTIRTDSKKVLGEFLALFINSDETQYKLKNIGAGATITSIPKKELEQVKIYLPDLDEQRRIVEFARLLDDEVLLIESLLHKKYKLKKKFISNLLFDDKKKKP